MDINEPQSKASADFIFDGNKRYKENIVFVSLKEVRYSDLFKIQVIKSVKASTALF